MPYAQTTVTFSVFSTLVELARLIKFSRPFLTLISKAKAAKLVRALVDKFLDMEAATGKEVRGHLKLLPVTPLILMKITS